ncbi:type IV secretion system protein VirB10 [Caballeronia sordidicola]|uniref:Inner membrane protein forms channel for type IV secretion of T-DNA complex (VirB10) n=1 Tax=Caballeronia sordidicola TaxID=196367 RepID=A0A242MWX0_CABSO|nr:type IV secretion system protein VirB10 [Caballeronia sordidicola]OTP75614.1 Inner membrane protein forms channel for type IV secretion of T-DNA complex (VirB10) [Caballeronia sordidicola]
MNGIEAGSGHEGEGHGNDSYASGMSSISNEAGAAGAANMAGDRGMPNLKQTRKKANVNKLTAVAIAVIALATVTLGGAMFAKRLQDQHNQAKADARTAPKEMGADTGHDFSVDADRLKREKAAAAEQASISAAQSGASMPVPSGAPASAVAVTSVGGHAGAAAQSVPHIETVAERRLDGDVLLNNGDDKGGTGATNGTGNSDGKSASLVPVVARGVAGRLDDRLTPSALPSVKASFLPDLDYLLKRGIIIPCAQKTKIVTTYSGTTSCIVTQDVYSADGRTLLVERGSEATGEQRTALMQGQARIFVLWSRIDMPNGVTIPLDSPGSDSLGASGLEAYVDTHFWDRFGGAIMVSLIGDFGQAASNRSLGSGNNQIQFSNTSSAGQSLADDTLKNTVDIPPTAYSNQGSALNIFVARDVDFRSVYDLEHQQ